MPINSNPDDFQPYSLQVDRAKPEAGRPAFLFRFPTCVERAALYKLYDQACALVEEKPEESMALLDQVLAGALVGWRNMTFRGDPVEFGGNEPRTFLTPGERWELAGAFFAETTLGERDRKNSACAPPSGAGHSAPTADPDAAKPAA